jgi:hypothetical protein
MSVLLIGAAGMVGSVAGQNSSCDTANASSMTECDASMTQYQNMLGSLYGVAHITLQYAGFIAVFAGAILWFTAKRSSDRAQTGVWLLIGGLIMIIFYFGFEAFVSVLRWVAEGDGGNA